MTSFAHTITEISCKDEVYVTMVTSFTQEEPQALNIRVALTNPCSLGR